MLASTTPRESSNTRIVRLLESRYRAFRPWQLQAVIGGLRAQRGARSAQLASMIERTLATSSFGRKGFSSTENSPI